MVSVLDGIRCVYVRRVKPGSVCPRYPASARMSTPPVRSTLAKWGRTWTTAAEGRHHRRSGQRPAPGASRGRHRSRLVPYRGRGGHHRRPQRVRPTRGPLGAGSKTEPQLDRFTRRGVEGLRRKPLISVDLEGDSASVWSEVLTTVEIVLHLRVQLHPAADRWASSRRAVTEMAARHRSATRRDGQAGQKSPWAIRTTSTTIAPIPSTPKTAVPPRWYNTPRRCVLLNALFFLASHSA